MLVGIFDQLAIGGKTGRDQVNVQVQWYQHSVRRWQLDLGKPRFLADFPQGHFRNGRFAISVPPRLEPAVEFGVMNEQTSLKIVRQDPGGTGDVPRSAGSFKTIRSVFH